MKKSTINKLFIISLVIFVILYIYALHYNKNQVVKHNADISMAYEHCTRDAYILQKKYNLNKVDRDEIIFMCMKAVGCGT